MSSLFHLERLLRRPRAEGSSLPNAKSEQEDNEELMPERAFQIFFLSFRFSQGSNSLQQHIWSYLHATNPQWRITEEMEQFMKEKSPPVFEKFLWGKEMLHPTLSRSTLQWGESWSGLIGERSPKELDFKSFLRGKIEEMRDIFNTDVNLTKQSKKKLVELILEGIIKRDHKFLDRHRRDSVGRPRSRNTENYTIQTDPFLSHICYYAVEQHSTGSPEYDQMFQDVRSALRSVVRLKKHFLGDDKLVESFKWDLAHTIHIYQTHHPENGLDAFFQNLLHTYPELRKNYGLRLGLSKIKDI